MPSRKGKRPTSKKGQTLVEVTLILPLLIVLVGAALDFGLLFFVSHVVQNAVREGARDAVTRTSITATAIETVVANKMPNSGLFGSFRNAANIGVSCTITGGQPFIVVTSNGNFGYYFMRILGLNTVALNRSTTMHYERLTTCPPNAPSGGGNFT